MNEFYPGSIRSDILGSVESFYSKYNQLQRIFEDDSSSDSSSLFSSNSDEGSFCTDSTQDSICTDDLLDSVLGDSICDWSSPCRSSDSDASTSSSSTLYSRHSPLANLDRYSSGSPGICASQKASKANDPLFHSDTSKQCRNIGVSSSSFRETESDRFRQDNPLNDVAFRKSRIRTD